MEGRRVRDEHLEPLTLDPLVLRWETAERQLSATVLAAPERYELCLRLVRALADELRTSRTMEELASAYPAGRPLAARVAGALGVSAEGLALDLAVGAAFCLRYRELLVETRRAGRVERIRAARERGEEWVVLHATGAGDGPPDPPWRRLEMHLPSGRGILASVEESVEGPPEYGVEVVLLDPESGSPAPAPALERRAFRDPAAWSDAAEEVRSRVGAGGFDSHARRPDDIGSDTFVS